MNTVYIYQGIRKTSKTRLKNIFHDPHSSQFLRARGVLAVVNSNILIMQSHFQNHEIILCTRKIHAAGFRLHVSCESYCSLSLYVSDSIYIMVYMWQVNYIKW